jgi:NADH-quinone oxidoreductase subunit C
MDAAALIERVAPHVPGAALEAAPSTDMPTVYVPAASIVPVCTALRDHAGFSLLIDVTAVDYLPRTPRYEVVYHLCAPDAKLRARLKVKLAEGETVPTVQPAWPAAGWPEREVWDLFGIVFDGHEDLRRILTPDDWEGHPLRKDYPVQVRKTPQTYEPLEVTEQEFRANIERDRLKRDPGAKA